MIGSQAESPTRCSDAEQISCAHDISIELGRWIGKVGEPSSKKNFVVFVSAAGGGLRAGYWTASILARLYDCVPSFNQRLFAISGVSGGSLGAGLYAALVRDAQANHETSSRPLNCADHPVNVSDAPLAKRTMQSKLTGFLENDFLAPVVASLLFRDLPQSIIPIQFIPESRCNTGEKPSSKHGARLAHPRIYGPDCLEPNQFERSFFQVRDSAGWVPVLFLNGTHEETGKRLITSQVQIDQASFFDALDFFDLVGRDVSLSTAVLNSARFPFVSPSGALTRHRAAKDIELTGSIIDGGFFENNGATTLQEVVDATMKYLKNTKPLTNWKPLVIEITNDVEIQETELSRRRRDEMFKTSLDVPLPVKPRSDTEIASQLLSTAMGLYATRTARGILASKMLSDFVVDKSGGEFVQFRLCPHMRPSPPLGWLLTGQSRNSMDQLILAKAWKTRISASICRSSKWHGFDGVQRLF